MHGDVSYFPTVTARMVELQKSPEAAWQDLQAAASAIGKIEEASGSVRYLVLKARYGFNPVRLRISVLSGPTTDAARLDFRGAAMTCGALRAER